MKRQRGQSAVEFALISPIIFLFIFAAIYGGAMFIQFLNFNNEARTVARQIAMQDTEDEQQKLIEKYNNIGEVQIGLYMVKMTAWIEERTDTAKTKDVVVRYDFNRDGNFPFDFPPSHFATSFTMKSEATTSEGSS